MFEKKNEGNIQLFHRYSTPLATIVKFLNIIIKSLFLF